MLRSILQTIRPTLLATSLLASPLAWAATQPATTPAPSNSVPAPDSPQAIQDLHHLLTEAYLKGEQARQGIPPVQGWQSVPGHPTVMQPIHTRPVLAAWVEVLRDAITTASSAAFIAAWGFAIGMLLIGLAALIFAVRFTRRNKS